MNPATSLFLLIGALGIAIAVIAMFGSEIFNIGDGLFSTEAVSSFLGAMGFGAAAANELAGDSIGTWGALGIGVIVAVPLTLLAVKYVRRLGDMRTDATPTIDDLAGNKAVVVTAIPAGGYGEVRARIGGQPMKLYARASQPIELGASVEIVEALSETSVIVRSTSS